MSAIPAQLALLLHRDEAARSRPSLLARILAAIEDARMRQAEREIARFIEARGGRITDALERQIERHFG